MDPYPQLSVCCLSYGSSLCGVPQLTYLSAASTNISCYASCLSSVPSHNYGRASPCVVTSPTAAPTAQPSGCLTTNCTMCDLVAAMNPASYGATDGWHCSGSPPAPSSAICSWYGVHCGGHDVTGIYLANLGISGSIPSSLGTLSSLRFLDLYGNTISGTIPSSLGRLKSLLYLLLDSNHLHGPIPTTIGLLSKLW